MVVHVNKEFSMISNIWIATIRILPKSLVCWYANNYANGFDRKSDLTLIQT